MGIKSTCLVLKGKKSYSFQFLEPFDDTPTGRLCSDPVKQKRQLIERLKKEQEIQRLLEFSRSQIPITMLLYNLGASVIHEDKLLNQRRVGG